MNEKFLPVGSVVMLKGASKRLLVTGFCVTPNDDKANMFDYSGCLYPEGVLSSDQVALFNHNQIDKIYAIGYSDDEEKAFKVRLKEELEKKDN